MNVQDWIETRTNKYVWGIFVVKPRIINTLAVSSLAGSAFRSLAEQIEKWHVRRAAYTSVSSHQPNSRHCPSFISYLTTRPSRPPIRCSHFRHSHFRRFQRLLDCTLSRRSAPRHLRRPSWRPSSRRPTRRDSPPATWSSPRRASPRRICLQRTASILRRRVSRHLVESLKNRGTTRARCGRQPEEKRKVRKWKMYVIKTRDSEAVSRASNVVLGGKATCRMTTFCKRN